MPKAESTKTSRAAKEPKEAKTPTLYQLFMKERLPEYKKENPGVDHKEAFKSVALEWKDSDKNPNKGKEKPKREPKPKAEKVAAPKKTKKKAPVAKSSDAEEEDDAADDDASSN